MKSMAGESWRKRDGERGDKGENEAERGGGGRGEAILLCRKFLGGTLGGGNNDSTDGDGDTESSS